MCPGWRGAGEDQQKESAHGGCKPVDRIRVGNAEQGGRACSAPTKARHRVFVGAPEKGASGAAATSAASSRRCFLESMNPGATTEDLGDHVGRVIERIVVQPLLRQSGVDERAPAG